ncbi:MAG: roadblock/LC7 domain-containing protein [candidate division KSB1 bacterium]|nr:roadblock/LC7 domain-containing protein [candidate division KSB1 bacterium]MDZ7335095.1 roadblock/LC7 domain-containing protein [candidate division KSB1 bacterium]MDZ7356236.1 roadblock/LC7 domain-containing protein [candidate division KSB1 bacterium]MDZ7400041.1 roadblock/LC7 domain-containing protein [candidate division KSB1 bacterium]
MDLGHGDNGQSIVLSGEMYKSISEILSELAAKTRARAIIFSDMNGHPITQRGSATEINVSTMAALAAGGFAATAEIAKLIGEKKQFKYIFHEGENYNVYFSNVGDNFLLVLVFGSQTALGMIRIYTKRAIDSLCQLIYAAKEEEQKATQFLDIDFNKYLNEELDRAFKI